MEGLVAELGEVFAGDGGGWAGFGEEVMGKVAQGGHGLRGGSGSDGRGILGEELVSGSMQIVFDAPMVADKLE